MMECEIGPRRTGVIPRPATIEFVSGQREADEGRMETDLVHHTRAHGGLPTVEATRMGSDVPKTSLCIEPFAAMESVGASLYDHPFFVFTIVGNRVIDVVRGPLDCFRGEEATSFFKRFLGEELAQPT